MTVVVTRNVPDRFRGFLASAMLEIGSGVYTSSQLSAGVRDRIWAVLDEWFVGLPDSSIVMVWRDPSTPAGQGLRVLGTPPIDLVELDGIIVARKRRTTDN
ncbi:MAG: type I-E CRISPR-associated endoribonuclease Cas2e [Limnochordia bacterium]|jgi:CRISPR-associated protein Cas2